MTTPRSYFQWTRPEMVPFLPEQRRTVLEIGCGEGGFIGAIPGTQETWGIEPDVTSAQVAATRLTRVLNGTFELMEDQLPQKHFDVVICNDVIEHMVDHDRFFHRIRPYLREGGVLVGSIPNVRFFRNMFEFLILRDWHYRDMGILDRTHLRFFTERSLRRSLQEAEYTIEMMHGINEGLIFGWSKWELGSFAMAWIAIALSLGRFRDIRYLQFGFRARPE